jgi:hypothetical protein
MGILDDAIREHLDLKRRHGAREAELREIEDEALGAGDQPDPFVAGNELFGEVSTSGTPEAGPSEAPPSLGEVPGPDRGGEEPTRLVEPEALQREPEEAIGESATPELIPGQTELPGQDEVPGQERLDQPLEGQRPSEPIEGFQPSAEPEPSEPAEDFQPSAEPEPPSPSESLEELIAEEEPFPEDSAAPPPDAGTEPGPSADRGGALESTELEPTEEPGVSVPEPPPPPPPGPEPPGRARGRVDVPTQEHPPPGETGGLPAVPGPEPESAYRPEPLPDAAPEPEPEAAREPAAEPAPEAELPEAPASDAPQLYDFETDDEAIVSAPPPDEPSDEFEALGPADEEAPYLDEEEHYPDEPASGTEPGRDTEPPLDEPGTEIRPAAASEETDERPAFDPDEAHEEDDTDEGLWFEQGPPKDFDFDD